jgi:hypothetical protein
MRTIVTLGTSVMLAALVVGAWAMTNGTMVSAEMTANRAGMVDPLGMMKNTDTKRLPVHNILDAI